MSTRKLVQFVEHRSSTVPKFYDDVWQVRPCGRWARLQKLAQWFLIKTKASQPFVDEQVKVERHYVDGDRFMERLLKQRESHFEWGREPKTLLIGSKDYAELMNEVMTNHHFSFTSDLHMGRDGKRMVVGLEVQVIPWMEGIVVMPSERARPV